MTSADVFGYVASLEEALRRSDKHLRELTTLVLRDPDKGAEKAAHLLADLGHSCPRCLGCAGLADCEICWGFGHTLSEGK